MSDLAKTVLVSMAKPSIPDRGGGLIGDRRGLGRYPRTRLHAARLAAGLSQTQVAEKLGMSQKAYAAWERHPVALRADQIEQVIEVLGISANDFFGKKQKSVRKKKSS